MEKEEQRIQKLVAEGIAKANEEEKVQKLIKKEIAQEKIQKENNKYIILIILLFVFAISIFSVVFTPNNQSQTQINTEYVSQSQSSEIIKEANILLDNCNGKTGQTYITNCQKLVDYLYIHRTILDKGDNWATITIASVESKISKQRTLLKSNSETQINNKVIFEESIRLNQNCNDEIDITNRMMKNVWGSDPENTYITDKSAAMSVVNQAQREDSVCLVLGNYISKNLKVLDSGNPKNWGTDRIYLINANKQRHENWYGKLNQQMKLSIQPSNTRVITTYTTTTSTDSINTPTERTYSPGDSVDIVYTTDDSEIQNAIKRCGEAGAI